MGTTKPRITITLEPRVHDVLRRMAELGGESMSAVVTNLLDVAIPQMERAVAVMQRAKDSPEEVRTRLATALAKAEQKILPHLVASLEQADWVLQEASSLLLAEEVAALDRGDGASGGANATTGAPAARSGAPNPRASNRGVRSAGPVAKPARPQGVRRPARGRV